MTIAGATGTCSPRIVLFEAHYDQLNMTTVTTFVYNDCFTCVSAPLKIKTYNRYRKPQHLNEKLIKHEMFVSTIAQVWLVNIYII